VLYKGPGRKIKRKRKQEGGGSSAGKQEGKKILGKKGSAGKKAIYARGILF